MNTDTTNVGWGHQVAVQHLEHLYSAIDAEDAAKRRRQQFDNLVQTFGDPWMERFRLSIEAAAEGFNGVLKRPFLRVIDLPRSVGVQLRARDQAASSVLVAPDYAPVDPHPGIKVMEGRRGGTNTRHYRFVDGGEDGLQLRVNDVAFSAEDAARAIVEPWCGGLDVVAAERAYQSGAERVRLDSIVTPKRVDQPPNVQINTASVSPELIAAVTAADPFQEPWTPGMYRAVAQTGRLFVAMRGTDVVGLCVIGAVVDGTIEIERIGVIENERRQGIGAALLRYALAKGAKAGAVSAWADIQRGYEAAQRLYTSIGFHSDQQQELPQ